jgi:hypothetical protein
MFFNPVRGIKMAARNARVTKDDASMELEQTPDQEGLEPHTLSFDQDEPEINSDRDARIAELAYYKAEQRGFEPGHELEDWYAAEQEINIPRT